MSRGKVGATRPTRDSSARPETEVKVHPSFVVVVPGGPSPLVTETLEPTQRTREKRSQRNICLHFNIHTGPNETSQEVFKSSLI